MFKNYFKTAWRTLFRNKVLSLINIAGLALGMAGAVLLIMNIQYELSIDQFHAKKDFIYKAYNKGIINNKLEAWNETSASLAPILQKDYPEIKQVARVAPAEKLFSYQDKKLKAQGSYADASFLNMFSFPLLQGNAATALNDVHSIVITEQLAKKLFGNSNPMNKVIVADNPDSFTITGVLKDLPHNTDFRFDYLVSWQFLQSKGIDNSSWDNNYVSTYAELQPHTNVTLLNNQIADVITKNAKADKPKTFLYPFAEEHLYGRFENGVAAGGNIDNLYMLGILAGIILFIACINFMNLSTARNVKRAKEVGVRKVMGAVKRVLVLQFISESILFSFLAGIVALIIVQLLLPVFSSLANAHLIIPYTSIAFWLFACFFILFTGVLAGSYPAFYLSSFKPVKVLKGILKNGSALVTPRKILVVVQFVLSIFLINFTILFQKQNKYLQNRETGYVKENLIYHPMTDDLQKNYPLLKNELISSGIVTSVCESNTTVTRKRIQETGFKWGAMSTESNTAFDIVTTSGDFIKTNGLALLTGRDIDIASFPTDSSACLVNEAALKIMGFKDPVGQVIKDGSVNWRVIGVVKDFLIGNANQASSPMLMEGRRNADFISMRLANTSTNNLKSTEAVIKKYNPDFLTEIQFADQDYAFKFQQAKGVAILINSFAFIAIFISCMGLFGLSIYMAENRLKEIGIRKVLGATVLGVTLLLAKDFIKLVMIAIAIASPLAWLFMNSFLQNFSYRTIVNWWILPAAGTAAILIALITISFQSVKAAVANPVKSLRTE